jgi:hypothetical protein
VWALDYQYDQSADGRILKLLHVVDEFTREAWRSSAADESTLITPQPCWTGSSPSATRHRRSSAATTGRT